MNKNFTNEAQEISQQQLESITGGATVEELMQLREKIQQPGYVPESIQANLLNQINLQIALKTQQLANQ